MEYCPHCNDTLLYGDNPVIHIIRKISGSHKRYCPACGRKWLGRSRRYNSGGVFIFVLLCGITGMFGFFQVSGSFLRSGPKSEQPVTGMIYRQALKSIGDNPEVRAQIRKMGADPDKALAKLNKMKNDPAAMAKFKKLQANPAAMQQAIAGAGGGGYSKEMMEKAMKYMDR